MTLAAPGTLPVPCELLILQSYSSWSLPPMPVCGLLPVGQAQCPASRSVVLVFPE